MPKTLRSDSCHVKLIDNHNQQTISLIYIGSFLKKKKNVYKKKMFTKKKFLKNDSM